MVSVRTSNGKFNISESLFEAIKSNNPEFLVETLADDFSNIDSEEKLSNFLSSVSLLKNNVNMSSDTKKEIEELNDIFNKSNNKTMNDVYRKIKSFADKDAKDILDKLGEDIEVINNKISEQPGNENNNNSDSGNENNNNNNNNNNNSDSGNENNYGIEKMKQHLSNQNLIKQIAYTEKIAGLLVERCKKIIQRELGLWGDSTISNKSQETTPYNNPETGETEDINIKPYYKEPSNTGNDRNIETAELPKIGNKTPFSRKIKSEIQLGLFGGFKFYPAFSSLNDTDDIGKALKYYKSVFQRPSNTSNYKDIYDMINTEIAYKDGEYNIGPEDKEICKKFETMVFSFLHNVVYNLVINSSEKYNNIVRVLTWDDKLKSNFNINNTANVQQFDVREQLIYYINKSNEIPTLLLIAKPLFAKGTALAKSAYDTFSRFKLNID